jgi:16S rRNA (guanine527-N7)-methyltransferase
LEALKSLLTEGVAQLGLPVSAHHIDTLLGFLELLKKWNRVYNLTAVQDPLQMVQLHLLDSLAALPHLQGPRILDVGTGAGLPGIPLAVFAADMQFVLLDCNGKKTRFVQQAVFDLGLKNVEVVHARIEEFRPEAGFDAILTRAFTEMAEIYRLTRSLLNPHGIILAYKSKPSPTEIQELEHEPVQIQTIPLTIPGLNAARQLVSIREQA